MTTLKKDAAETATKAATGQSSALAFKTQAVLIEQDACSQHKHRSTLVVLLSWCFGVLVFWCFGRLGLAMKTRLGQTPRMYTCRRLGPVTRHALFGDALLPAAPQFRERSSRQSGPVRQRLPHARSGP